MPKTLAELKDSVLAWAMIFIVSVFAAGLAYHNQRIADLTEKDAYLPREYVRLERYQADQTLYRETLRRIETNIDKLLIMAAKED